MKISKWFKKHPNVGRAIIALVAVIMVLSLMIPAAAFAEPSQKGDNIAYDETPSITVVGVSSPKDTLVAYQLIAGKMYAPDSLSSDKTELRDFVFSDAVNDNVLADLRTHLGFLNSELNANDAKVTFDALTQAQRVSLAEKMASSLEKNSSVASYEVTNNQDGTAFIDLSGAGTTSDKVDPGVGVWLVLQKNDNGSILGASLVDVIDDAEVSIANPKPLLVKSIAEESSGNTVAYTDASGGEYVKFLLRSNISSDADEYVGDYKMIFTDTLENGFLFDQESKAEDNISLSINSSAVSKTTKNSDGTFTENWKVEFRDNSVQVTVVNSNLLKNNAGREIVFSYKAKVDAPSLEGDNLLVAKSNAKLEYTSDKNSNVTEVIEQQGNTDVYSYKASGSLVDNDNNSLTGASFKVGTFDGWATLAESDTPGKYYITGVVDNMDSATEMWVDENGKFEIIGFDFDAGSEGGGAFQLTEITAPEGYTVPEENFIVKLNATINNPNTENVDVDIVGSGGIDGQFAYDGNTVLIGNEKYVDPNAITLDKIITVIVVIIILAGVGYGGYRFIQWRRDQYDWDDDDWDDDDWDDD